MCQYSLCRSDSAWSQTSLKTYVLHMTEDKVSHDTWSAQGKMCFHHIFFAAKAVRLVSFLFTLYSSRMFNAQGCVCRCERVVNVKTGSADSSRRMWDFPRTRFQRMRNNIRKRIIFLFA